MPAGSSGLNSECGKFRDGRGNARKTTQMQKLAKCMNQVGVIHGALLRSPREHDYAPNRPENLFVDCFQHKSDCFCAGLRAEP
jgi:hypothetical protein